MNILIVSATQNEIANIMANCTDLKTISSNYYTSGLFKKNTLNFLITGIGYHATIYQLTRIVSKQRFNLVINVGIAGSLDNNLSISETVLVRTEQFYDLQIENSLSNQFAFESNLIAANDFPFKNGHLECNYDLNKITDYKKVAAITSNTIHGNIEMIKKINKDYTPAIETMEGAGVFYVCMLENLSFIELRTISNKVGFRDKENWDITTAIEKLNVCLANILTNL